MLKEDVVLVPTAVTRAAIVVACAGCGVYAYGDGNWLQQAFQDSQSAFEVILAMLCLPICHAICLRAFAYDVLGGYCPWWAQPGGVALLLCMMVGAGALEVAVFLPRFDEYTFASGLTVPRRYALVFACFLLSVLLLDWGVPARNSSWGTSWWTVLKNRFRPFSPNAPYVPPAQRHPAHHMPWSNEDGAGQQSRSHAEDRYGIHGVLDELTGTSNGRSRRRSHDEPF